MKEEILKLLAKSEPLKNAEIAEKLNLDVKEVTNLTKELKKKGEIVSPKRCYYTALNTDGKTALSKKEFISLYKKSGDFKTKIEAEDNLNMFLDLVSDVLDGGKSLNFTGWGKFELIEKKERQGRNPQNGKVITIPAKRVIKFKPGKKLNEKINN